MCYQYHEIWRQCWHISPLRTQECGDRGSTQCVSDSACAPISTVTEGVCGECQAQLLKASLQRPSASQSLTEHQDCKRECSCPAARRESVARRRAAERQARARAAIRQRRVDFDDRPSFDQLPPPRLGDYHLKPAAAAGQESRPASRARPESRQAQSPPHEGSRRPRSASCARGRRP